MKRFLKVFLAFILAAIMVLSASCAMFPAPDVEGGTWGREDYDDSGYAPTESGYAKGGDYYAGESDDGQQYQIQPGQLTCGALNDAKNYEDWVSLFNAPQQGSQEGQENGGAFYNFLQGGWSFNTLKMVEVTVKNGGFAVPYAKVELSKNGEVLFRAKTDARGIALVFLPEDGEHLITASKEGKTQSAALLEGESQKEISLSASTELTNAIDLMFVIDTTGSMSDELRYLQKEIEDVVHTVKENNPQADIKIALMFYRDNGDEYVIRCFNFESNINKVKNNLKDQGADGGGDYEEAVDLALYLAVFGGSYTDGKRQKSINFDWREDSTKILVHVLDAPPHDGGQFQQRYFSALAALAKEGIRVVTVASSGVDGKCEYLCRTASLITQGRYVFLTNHSGIGGDHKDPEAKEYVVEYLNGCLVRLIEEIHTGVETEPVPIFQDGQEE